MEVNKRMHLGDEICDNWEIRDELHEDYMKEFQRLADLANAGVLSWEEFDHEFHRLIQAHTNEFIANKLLNEMKRKAVHDSWEADHGNGSGHDDDDQDENISELDENEVAMVEDAVVGLLTPFFEYQANFLSKPEADELFAFCNAQHYSIPLPWKCIEEITKS